MTVETAPAGPADAKLDPKTNTFPGLLFGIQALVGTIWWLLLNFAYIKNVSSDDNLRTIAGNETLPVGWFWERLGETNGQNGWLAASLFTGWWGYLIVSVMEFAAWIFYETGMLGFAEWYFSMIGYWTSLTWNSFPWLCAAVHMGIYGVNAFPGSWSILLLVVQVVLWLVIGLIHIIYIDEFMAYVGAQTPTNCECDLPPVPELPDNAHAEAVAARKAAVEERESLCKIQCPDGDKAPAAAAAESAAAGEDSNEDEEGW